MSNFGELLRGLEPSAAGLSAGIKVRDKRPQPNLRGRAAFTNGPRKHPNFFVDIGVLPLGIRVKIIP